MINSSYKHTNVRGYSSVIFGPKSLTVEIYLYNYSSFITANGVGNYEVEKVQFINM
jgi:hypothetical protein